MQLLNGSHFTLYRVTVQNSPNFHVVAKGTPGTAAPLDCWNVFVPLKSVAPSLPAYCIPGHCRNSANPMPAP
ncbi:hypothetical protein [Ralstonia sp. A12]|uniref:hypothetical protein n=1 Tax=Ralstonia sp. A12 TaxID=1217052 RepID=UPI000A9152DC